MKLLHMFIGIYVLLFGSILGTLTGRNQQHAKQFTLSCTGMDYSARKQRMLQKEDELSLDTFKGLYPEGQEVLYSYSAVVTTGTNTPAPFISQFNLTGMIKVQGFKDKARVQLYNVKFAMNSGDFLGERDFKFTKMPGSAATLYVPFDIFYKDGQVSKLEMTAGTPQWSKSIKQSLSGMLQLQLRKIDTEKFSSFVTNEKCIHGECAVLYSVKPENNKILVTKFYSADDCQRNIMDWSNIDIAPGCLDEVIPNEKLDSYSQKTYRVTPYGNETLLIREVFSEGKTSKFVKQKSNSTHYVTVSQKLQLVSMNGITRTSEIANPEEIRTLEFDATQFSSFKFSTNDDLNNVVKKVFQLLPGVRSELEKGNNMLSEQVNPQESHLIPLLITYLRKLDFSSLQQILVKLEKNSKKSSIEMYIKILPLVGSKASALFLVKLIKDKKVGDFDAELLLSSLPFHTRQISEEDLIKFEDLLHLPDSRTNSVRNAAVLSFATLVYKTCKWNSCKDETIGKYSNYYIEMSNEYTNQMVYVAGLNNLHVEKVVDVLQPMIQGEEPASDESVRVLGLRALFPIVSGNPDKAFEIYWPIFINRENSLELRAIALVLLMEAQHESSIYTLIQHVMKPDDTDSHLYNIYYRIMKSFSEEIENCHLTRTRISQKIIKYMKKPVISQFLSSHYTFPIGDGQLNLLTIVNPLIEDGISVYISYSSKHYGIPINYYSIYIKLTGVDGELLNNILSNIFDPSKVEEMLEKLIQNKLIPENFQLEFTLFSQQQTIILRNYNKNNIENLVKDIISIFKVENLTPLSLMYATSLLNTEVFFITDIGFPGVLSLDFPNLLSSHSQNIATDNSIRAGGVDTSFNFGFWFQGSTVLKVKNPIVDIWQGIMNSYTSRFTLPLNLKVNFEDKINVQLKKGSNEENNEVGFKWHTQTDIFTVTDREGYDALTESCKDCKSHSSVKTKTAQIIQEEVQSDGYSLYRKIFDCEDDGTTNLLKSILHFNSPDILYSLGSVISAGFFLESYLLDLPISGSCGYASVFVPQKECCVSVAVEYHRNNISILIGSSEGSAPDAIVSLLLDESRKVPHNSDQLKEECRKKLAPGFEEKLKEQFKGKVSTCRAGKSNGHAENLDWCEKEMKPQIMSCMQTELNKSGRENIIKVSAKTNKLSRHVVESIDGLFNDIMDKKIYNTEGSHTSEQTEALLSINFAKSKYSLSLQTFKKYFAVTGTLC